MSAPDGGCSRSASYALILIYTFLLHMLVNFVFMYHKFLLVHFTAGGVSDFSDECYYPRPSLYTSNSVTSQWVLDSSFSDVGDLYPFSTQTTASSQMLSSEVEPKIALPLDGPVPTDSLCGYIPHRMGVLSYKQEQCQVCGFVRGVRAVLLSLRHFQEVIHVQPLLMATDNTTIVAYCRNKEEITHLLCWEILLLCDSLRLLSVRHFPDDHNCIADASSRFHVPCSSEYGMGVTSGCCSVYDSKHEIDPW